MDIVQSMKKAIDAQIRKEQRNKNKNILHGADQGFGPHIGPEYLYRRSFVEEIEDCKELCWLESRMNWSRMNFGC